MGKTDLVPAEKMEGGEVAIPDQTGMAIATTRAAQEVQAAMVVAKKFPRNTIQAEKRILDACKRTALAEQAMYAYPRGDTTVEGPSIRLAEVLAQNWGNIDTGIIELEQNDGESTMMAYCWDLETNTRQTKIFTVKHWRDTKRGGYALKDKRDIYEMTANQGARRQRSCILGVIPGDIIDKAKAECNKTLRGNQSIPLIDRAKKMVTAFEELSVTQEMIEKRLGHRLETISETELVNLRKVWTAINDNMQPVDAYFGPGTKPAESGSLDPADALGAATEETTAPGGTAETALQPEVNDPETPSDEPISDQNEPEIPDNETPAPEPETSEEDDAPVPDAPESGPEAPQADEPQSGTVITDVIKAAWKAKLEETKQVIASDEFVDMQLENFCLNYWTQGKGPEGKGMTLYQVAELKPNWLPKLLGYIEDGQIPPERYAYKIKEATPADDKPKRPGRRRNK